MNSQPRVRVVKLGGSLLDLAGLADLLRRWLSVQSPAANVVVVGGGALADVVRRMDGVHRLEQRTSHHLCLEAMGMTARMVEQLLPEAKLVLTLKQLDERLGRDYLSILDVRRFMEQDQAHSAEPLPEHWDVTSDSIAARVAGVIAAEELVLLKSTLPGQLHDLQQLSDGGYVDRYFPRAASDLSIRCVNLRDSNFEQACIAPAEVRNST